MRIKNNQYKACTQSGEGQSPDLGHSNPKYASSQHKNPYIGLTLMDYFKINNSKQELEEIDEESNSSISASTPSFVESKEKYGLICASKMGRTDNMKIQTQQDLFRFAKQDQEFLRKVKTINLDQHVAFDKTGIKLPFIHQHRHVSNSRQGMSKDSKGLNKKQSSKNRTQQNNNNNNNFLHNKVQKAKIQQFRKNALVMKRSIKARVTASTFYLNNAIEKQRERIRTEQQSIDRILEKSFIITKYGKKRTKEEIELQALEKTKNTLTILKNSYG